MKGNIGNGQKNYDGKYETALGRIYDDETWNKFGGITDLDTIDGTVSIWELPVRITRLTSASTFTITYNNATDGDGTTGALTLYFWYIDGNNDHQVDTHTLGSDGSDVTSFSGLGINRIIVLSHGGAAGTTATNVNAITVTATTGSTNQAYIPAGAGVTEQCFYHVPRNHIFLTDWLVLEAQPISGGNPVVSFQGLVHSMVTDATRPVTLTVFNSKIDTSNIGFREYQPSQPFPITGPALLEFTASSDTNNTQVDARFSGIIVNLR